MIALYMRSQYLMETKEVGKDELSIIEKRNDYNEKKKLLILI